MIVNLDVDVYTKSRINQKTLQKTKKRNRNRLRRGLVFTLTLPGRQFTPLSVTSLPLSLFTAQYNSFTCLWISSLSSFNEAFGNRPRYLA